MQKIIKVKRIFPEGNNHLCPSVMGYQYRTTSPESKVVKGHYYRFVGNSQIKPKYIKVDGKEYDNGGYIVSNPRDLPQGMNWATKWFNVPIDVHLSQIIEIDIWFI